MDRRAFLTALTSAGLAAAITPEQSFARAAMGAAADWRLATVDVEADIARHGLTRIHGRAPADLSGTLFRNGPAKFRRPGGDAGHWFDGDGLIRSFRIDDGQASLAARFVDTPKRRADTAAKAVVTPGFGTIGRADTPVGSSDDTNAANTSVMMLGGELLALWEAGSPFAVDPDSLATKGPKVFRPDLAHMPFLAHPRVEPSGRVWNLGVNGASCLVWRLSSVGQLEAAQMIQLPRASYLHDFTATDRHLVILLQPWIQTQMALPYTSSLAWTPLAGTQVLVIDKDDLSKRRIYDLPAFFFFHLGDAWAESDGTIRFDLCGAPDPTFALQGGRDIIAGRKPARSHPRLSMVALRPDGKATMETLDVTAEFPKSDARFAGKARRYSIQSAVAAKADRPLLEGVSVRDWKTGKDDRYDFGADQVAEEMVFVPRKGASAELDGWLVGTSLNLKARATELHVFDARRVAAGPVCSWRANAGMPVGFHGTFVAA